METVNMSKLEEATLVFLDERFEPLVTAEEVPVSLVLAAGPNAGIEKGSLLIDRCVSVEPRRAAVCVAVEAQFSDGRRLRFYDSTCECFGYYEVDEDSGPDVLLMSGTVISPGVPLVELRDGAVFVNGQQVGPHRCLEHFWENDRAVCPDCATPPEEVDVTQPHVEVRVHGAVHSVVLHLVADGVRDLRGMLDNYLPVRLTVPASDEAHQRL